MDELSERILHKEIDLIQTCINRMAHNSFLIKGWTVSLVVVVLALGDKVANLTFLCLILLLPIWSFWYLDAFFLHTEKKYRKMYEWVIENRQKGNVDFLYDLNPNNPNRPLDKVGTIKEVMFSRTLKIFYGIPLLVIAVIFVIDVFPVFVDLMMKFTTR